MPIRRSARRAAYAVALIVVVASFSACDPPPPPDIYVSLGDSYTSGPQIADQTGVPAGCLRSNRNYSALAYEQVAAADLGFGRFWDLSCSGARTGDFTTGQVTSDGTNLAQLAVLGTATKVVTIGIGGNDIGFSEILRSCLKPVPALQADCKPDYVVNGVDELRERIDSLAPTIDQVLDTVEERAPQAAVFVIGYPTILPDTGEGCWPAVPISGGDVAYLYGVEQYLNAMLQARASARGATFVDTATSSIGHDACAGSAKWVNGVSLSGDGAMFHPNAAGMDHTADLVAAAIEAHFAD